MQDVALANHPSHPCCFCCAQGLRFYLGMQDVARKCRQEAEDWVFTRQVQRTETKQVRGWCLSLLPAFRFVDEVKQILVLLRWQVCWRLFL